MILYTQNKSKQKAKHKSYLSYVGIVSSLTPFFAMSYLRTWYIYRGLNLPHFVKKSCTFKNNVSFSWLVPFSVPYKRSFREYLWRFAGRYILVAAYKGHVKKMWYALSKPLQCWQEGLSTMFLRYKSAFRALHCIRSLACKIWPKRDPTWK